MHPATSLFLFALALGLAVRIGLALRQIAFVRAHRATVPREFAAAVTAEAHAKAADYTVARTRFGIFSLVFGTLLVLFWTLGGGFALLDAWWRVLGWGPIATGVGVLVSLTVIGELVELPLEAWQAFRIEAAFGFNRRTPALFLKDATKGLLLALALTAALSAAALWLMRAAPYSWWLWVAVMVVGFSVLMTWAYPTFIAPWFNRFTPLPEGALKARVEALLARCGFTSKGVFVMDASTRSAHGNAYFTGVGSAKRIVLFDTLVERLTPEELEAVLAHELGHFRLHHVRTRLAVSAVATLLLLFVASLLLADLALYPALGVPVPSAHAALALLALAAPPFLLPFRPLSAWWSRRHEFQADDYAMKMSDAASMGRALVVLYRENATTLTPDPWFSAFHDSHPPPAARLARLAVGR